MPDKRMPSDRKEVTDWAEFADRATPSDPGELSRPRPIFMTVTLLLVAFTAAAVVGAARFWPAMALAAALLGAVVGLSVTLVSQAWAASIVFADQVRKGLWFAIFPPYMVVYSVRHWNWMWQPTLMFLAGLGLIAASLGLTGAFPIPTGRT